MNHDYPKFIEKIISSKEIEILAKINSDNSTSTLLQHIHLYTFLREELYKIVDYMEPIKNGVKMSGPFIGTVCVYFVTDTNYHLFRPYNERLIEAPINPKYKTKRKSIKHYHYYKRDIYIHSEGLQKSIGLPKNKRKVSILDKDLVIPQIKSALDFFKYGNHDFDEHYY